MEIDISRWSGEGTFTHTLVELLKTLDGIGFIRVEDAPATRSEADYNFISNEVYVAFATRTRRERVTRFGFLPGSREVSEKTMSLQELACALEAAPAVGAPDFADRGHDPVSSIRADRAALSDARVQARRARARVRNRHDLKAGRDGSDNKVGSVRHAPSGSYGPAHDVTHRLAAVGNHSARRRRARHARR